MKDHKEFITFMVTMVLGGLVYSIASFTYMHQTFSSKDKLEDQKARISRVESRIEHRLDAIDRKLDRIIGRAR
jgi:hypothetical protein